MVQQHKIIPYQLQENGTVEAFNKILEIQLTKECSRIQDDWDDQILVVLWDYMTTTNKLHENMTFHIVYGRESIVLTKFVVLILYIMCATHIVKEYSVV